MLQVERVMHQKSDFIELEKSSSKSYIAEGNKALRDGDYSKAVILFEKAKIEVPELRSLIQFNIEYANNFIVKAPHERGQKDILFFDEGDEREIFDAITKYKGVKYQSPKIAVYTCISGDYDSLITPQFLNPEWDYILFSDATIEGHSNYQRRELPLLDPDPVRMARYVKLNPHIVLPEYEYTIWIDGNVLLKGADFISEINEQISSGSVIAFRKHPDRCCTYAEINKCQELKKDDIGIMQIQIAKYANSGIPENYGLFETNVILRKNCSNVNAFNDIWWKELSNGSRRDQLSVMYAVYKSKITCSVFNEKCDIRKPENTFYYLYSHSPSSRKSDIKYKVPSFYHLKISSELRKGNNENLLSFEKLSIPYADYSVPHKISKAIWNARLRDSYEEYIFELDRISESNKELRAQVKWHKILHFFLLGDNEGFIKESLEIKDIIKNKVFAFYFYLFEQEVKNSVSLKSGNLTSSEKVEYYLSCMNVAEFKESRVSLLNEIFSEYGLSPVRALSQNSKDTLDDLFPARPIHRHNFKINTDKVSVAIPAYNAGKTIKTSIHSLLNQTWTNLEIIVIDDNSTDNTCKIVEEISAYDERVKLLKQNQNLGPYAARNLALDNATGLFFTIADADDWHHPDKILIQVKQLQSNASIIANVACWVRMHDDLNPIRRGNPFYKHLNISSLMFRREEVSKKLGYWNRVRFGGDSEFYKRLLAVFGKDSVYELAAITSIGRVEPASLTNNELFGYSGFPYGARREYLEIYDCFHREHSNEFWYENTDSKFPLPKPMDPNIVSIESSVEISLVGDFRIKSTTELAIGEIGNYLQEKKSFCLVQCNTKDMDPRSRVVPEFRSFLNQNKISLSVYGEYIFSEKTFVIDPDAIISGDKYLPEIRSNETYVIHTQDSIRRYINRRLDFEKRTPNIVSNAFFQNFLNERTKRLYLQSLEKNSLSTLNENLFSVINDCIQTVSTSEAHNFKYRGSKVNCVVMPCIDLSLGMKTAEILIERAGVDLTVVIAFDDLRQGFIKTLNQISEKVSSKFITFVAQDAFPGRNWLRLAFDSIEKNNCGLLGFNDGKWQGRIASFGMVRKNWINKYYDNEILNSAYRSHKADNEITVLAKLDANYIYCPESVLIEVDYNKDAGGSNPDDDLIFAQRFNSGFQFFPKEDMEPFRKEYKVK